MYEHLRKIAQVALRAGEHIIIDAAFLRTEERVDFMRLAQDEHASFHIVHCEAPDAELRQRLRDRGASRLDASEADERVLDQQKDYWEPFTSVERAYVVPVKTNEANALDDTVRAMRVGAKGTRT